jgi:hypothetical protein
MKWNLDGTYFESCNCEVACPCVFMSPPTSGECTVFIGWHIGSGSFGEVKLDGLNVAMAVETPRGTMTQTRWKAAVYLDGKASPPQKDALIQIFSGKAGGHPALLASFVGQMLGVRDAAIVYQADGKRRSLRIAGVVEAEIEAITGQGDGDVKIEGHPLCIAPGHASVVAKSKRLSYTDYGLHWELTGKNGFYSSFTYQGG